MATTAEPRASMPPPSAETWPSAHSTANFPTDKRLGKQPMVGPPQMEQSYPFVPQTSLTIGGASGSSSQGSRRSSSESIRARQTSQPVTSAPPAHRYGSGSSGRSGSSSTIRPGPSGPGLRQQVSPQSAQRPGYTQRPVYQTSSGCETNADPKFLGKNIFRKLTIFPTKFSKNMQNSTQITGKFTIRKL